MRYVEKRGLWKLAYQLLKQGMNRQEVIDELGCSPSVVDSAIKKLKLERCGSEYAE